METMETRGGVRKARACAKEIEVGVECEAAAASEGEGLERPPRPRNCRSYVQDRLARTLPGVMLVLEEKVLQGDLTVLKTLWQMAGLDEQEIPDRVARKRTEQTVARTLLKKLNELERGTPEQASASSGDGDVAKRIEPGTGMRN
jgi:hypothetical protein